MKADVYEDKRYLSWLEHANERDYLERFLRSSVDVWCPSKTLSMLEWGCGPGAAALRFFKILRENDVSFDYTGVEPFDAQLEEFRKIGEDVTLVQGDFETFTPSKAYDLALVIHSLYYTNMVEALEKTFEYADRAIIVHHGVNGINSVHEEFPDLVNRMSNRVSTYQDVLRSLEGLGRNYEFVELQTQVDIRPCKELNQEGRNMISFFLERTNLNEEEFVRVSEYFQERSDYMRHDIGVIFAS
jgi:hypothetical protein